MKRKLSIILAALSLWLMMSVPVFAANDIQIFVDGKTLAMDAKPTVSNGTTLVPMRAIFEALGATVNYDATTKQITGTKAADVVLLILNQTTATKNGAAVQLSVPPQAIDGRTMVPLRFISESLKCSVVWDGTTKTVTITSGGAANTATLYDVVRVVDGDTIVVNYNGTEEKVRMIGIDTPESVHPDTDKNTEAGQTASEYTKTLLENKAVSLEFDVQERDQYGRLLAYVYLNGTMVNKTLLEDGYANIATYPPNVKYVDDFTAIVAARDNSDVTISDTTETTEQTDTTGTQYYRTNTGKRYHDDPTCNGGTYYPCTLEEAKASGLTPCDKCIE